MQKTLLLLTALGVCTALLDFLLHYIDLSTLIFLGVVTLFVLASLALPRKPEPSGARWMGFFERLRLINRWHKGFVVNGRNARLSEKASMQSILAVGPMGSGKSATFCVPNILKLAEQECSLVINDISGGELYRLVSGYLADRGFRIRVLNLLSPRESHQFNPLSGLKSFSEVARAAATIVASSPSSHSDPYWTAGGEKLIRVIAQCLVNRNEEKYCNLANLKFLVSRLVPRDSGAASPLDDFVVASTLQDTTTFRDYEAILAGNPKTTLSFLATADTALSALGSADIALLTAKSTIHFQSLRKEKTALFLLGRQQDLRHLAFVANLFFQRLFDTLLEQRAPDDLDVYTILDEFGQLHLPDFDVVTTTARKFRLALWILVQSTAQIELRYGSKGAQIMRDSFGTHLYLPGVGVETAREVEQRLGKVKIPIGSGDSAGYRSENLIDAFDVTRLGSDEALLQYSNKPPVIITTTPYYEQRGMLRASQLPPFPLPQIAEQDVSYLDLC